MACIFSEELVATQQELDDVKASYVALGQERKASEQRLNEDWEQRLNVELHQLRLQLNSEHDADVEDLRAQNDVTLREAETKWRRAQETEVVARVDAEVARKRDEWLRAHQADVDAACDMAVEQVRPEIEIETRDRCAQEFEHHLQEGTPYSNSHVYF